MKSADRLQTANEERVISGMGASPRPYAVHLRRTFGFALPIMIARTALILMFTVDVLITGWAGGVELAYLGLGSAPQLTLILIAIGALQAGVVLMAQALGAEDGPRFRAAFAAMIVHAIFLGLIIIFLTIGTYPLFIATGQTPDIAAGAARIAVPVPNDPALTCGSLFCQWGIADVLGGFLAHYSLSDGLHLRVGG